VDTKKEIENELKRNIITPRTHRKKGEELEKWASLKHNEIKSLSKKQE